MSDNESIVKTDYRRLASEKWTSLPSRDQGALIILTLFLILFIGGYGGYTIKEMANDNQDSYQTEVNDYFWLRNQAYNIDPTQSNEQVESIDQQLTRELSQSNAKNVQVIMTGDDAQVTFEHDNQAIINNVLSNVINAGYELKQLNMTQNPDSKVIRVQVTVG